MSQEKTIYYSGYLLLIGGLKINFENIEEDVMDAKLKKAINSFEWDFEVNDCIWLEPDNLSIPASKVIGFSVNEHNDIT